jgi:hypothetical protein
MEDHNPVDIRTVLRDTRCKINPNARTIMHQRGNVKQELRGAILLMHGGKSGEKA